MSERRQVLVAAGTAKPLTLGRAPSNDVVVQDDTVSWHHALVWFDGGTLWVRDVGSRNGTFVDGERVKGDIEVAVGAVVRLGTTVELELKPVTLARSAPCWLLEDIEGGLSYPLLHDRFRIGLGGDLPLEGVEATLLLPAGEVWLGIDGEDRALDEGEEFELAGRRFRVVAGSPDYAPTREPAPERYPYRLEALLSGPTGPEATLRDLRTGATHRVEAENRAVLLYLLGRHQLDDAATPAIERGWGSDEEIALGICGRSWTERNVNGLHVLVYRLRKELEKAGFDPWFIEKKRRYIRGRFAEIQLD